MMHTVLRAMFTGGIISLVTLLSGCGCRPKCTTTELQVASACKLIAEMDSSERLAELVPLIEEVEADGGLEYLNYFTPQSQVILLTTGMVFRGTWNAETKQLHLNPRGIDGRSIRSPTDQEALYIKEWLERIAEFSVCRIDARSKSPSIRIYVAPSIYFLIMKANAPVEYFESINSWVRSGPDHRGDVCLQVSSNVYVATDRR